MPIIFLSMNYLIESIKDLCLCHNRDHTSICRFRSLTLQSRTYSLDCSLCQLSCERTDRRVCNKHLSALITADALLVSLWRSHSSLHKTSLPSSAQRAERHANVSAAPTRENAADTSNSPMFPPTSYRAQSGYTTAPFLWGDT